MQVSEWQAFAPFAAPSEEETRNPGEVFFLAFWFPLLSDPAPNPDST